MNTDNSDTGWDRVVGRNVQELRKAKGMTQADLAERLSDRGLAFRQQTIVKIEKGQRPLRLREADVIADVLEVDLDLLVEDDEPIFDRAALIVHNTNRVMDSWDALRQSAKELIQASSGLRFFLMSAAQNGHHEHIPAKVLNDAATVATVDPVDVVRGVMDESAKEVDIRNIQFEHGVENRIFKPEEWAPNG